MWTGKRLFDTDHLPMASAARQQSNTAIGIDRACIEALVSHVHADTTAVGPVAFLPTRCVRVCVVDGTRKILPWTMWLCLEEHTFAKEVEYVVAFSTH